MADWKDTCNLPRTAFSMKANLQTTEPETVARWEAMDLYGRIRAARKGATKYLLHDGPPYANGEIHMGHALNKILKDLVVKSHNMLGFDAPYIPGWDCHGLPIELKVDRELGPKKKQMSVADFRRACRAYAEKYVDVQRKDFKRLGILGTWDDPYKTLKFEYQAAIVRALGKFVEQGMVYKGKKPVHWCTHCRTALAEAEVEYENHVSPSIYVEFPMKDRDASVLIWTTTPWTIPNNLAVAFHPDFEYGLYDVDGKKIIIAKDLADTVGKKTGKSFDKLLETFSGRALEHVVFRHPLYARDSLGVLGEYVTLDAGTGAVHTAPGHGADDYKTGVRYGLEIYAPLDAAGHYNESVELFAGLKVWDANPKIEAALKERGRLWYREDFDHQYPHCWRCHNPVIFLATSQWFIAMDAKDLRGRALQSIRDTRWIPAWGQARIEGMIANRPDWCISRQRAWGVPIPAMDCARCGTPVLTRALVDQAASVFDVYGADSWYERPVEEFIPEGMTCAECGHTAFEREGNILDVWFDSGSSHEAVLPFREDHHWPADLYLEGSDQHRGWFHSSLLTSVAEHDRAPYRAVLTHGFTIDEKGRKMSKSLGNVIVPQKVIGTLGADVLRLWIAATDYANEMSLSDEILKRVAESYRRMRNTARFLLGNLAGFDPAADQVQPGDMVAIDRWALWRAQQLQDEVVAAYRNYQFHLIYQKVHNFCSVDLGGFYLDVLKDRLYTTPAKSHARRSAQTAMFWIAEALVRWLAPILSFTSEEIWKFMPGPRSESVFFNTWVELPRDAAQRPSIDWDAVLKLRSAVQRELEKLRNANVIGAPLDAEIDVYCAPSLLKTVQAFGEELRFVFITSGAQAHPAEQRPAEAVAAEEGDRNEAWIVARPSSAVKCVRCWHKRKDVGSDSRHPELCARCVTNVEGPGEQRRFS